MYNRLIKEFVGKKMTIDAEHEVELDDLSTYKNRVRVQKVPFEMEDNTLKALLERYGKVENITLSLKKFGDYDAMTSDERIVWMIVEYPFPSSLFVKDSKHICIFLIWNNPKLVISVEVRITWLMSVQYIEIQNLKTGKMP